MNDLWAAIHAGDCERAEQLVALGINLDETFDFGRTALIEATIEGREIIVQMLLRAGANTNAHDREGWTALHFAAQGHHVTIARLLIESGAEIDSVDAHGNTPLFRAVFASRGRGEMLCLLLDAGADRNRKNASGVSPLELAMTIGNYSVRQFFN